MLTRRQSNVGNLSRRDVDLIEGSRAIRKYLHRVEVALAASIRVMPPMLSVGSVGSSECRR